MIDHHLSTAASNYKPPGFIADRIFPTITVDDSDLSGLMGLPTYTCKEHSLRVDVTLEDRATADPVFIQQFEEGRVMRVVEALFLDWEVRAAKELTNPDNIGASEDAGHLWTDHDKPGPLADVLRAIDTVELASGKRPNRILFSGTAWRHFRRNVEVIDKAGNPGIAGGGLYPDIKQASDLLGVVALIGNAWQNNASEEMPLNLEQVWGNHVLVYYTSYHPHDQPSFGVNYQFGVPAMRVHRLPYDSRRNCSELEVEYSQAEVIQSKSMGCLIRNVTGETGR